MRHNRVGVTLRFNNKELSDLAALCEFWNRPEKDVLKLAFYQLVSATHELQNKLNAQQKQQESEACETTNPEPSPEAPSPSSSESASSSSAQSESTEP